MRLNMGMQQISQRTAMLSGVVLLSLAVVGLTGCAKMGLKDGSLDYKKDKTITPLVIPEGVHIRQQQALYPAPTIAEQALEQAPELKNKYGNRYQLPRPEQSIVATGTSTLGAPQLVTAGNAIPLLKVSGAAQEIWQHALAALSVANLTVASNKVNENQVQLNYDGVSYWLRLSSTGQNQSFSVLTNDKQLADADIALQILTLLHQNWPA